MIQIYDKLPEAAKRIREEVFMKEQGFQDEFDSLDAISRHVVIEVDGIPAGTCRFYQGETPSTWVIGRVAVSQAYRGRHLGSLLIEAAEKDASQKQAERMILHAQCTAAPFYEKLGYKGFGEVDEDEGCPHIWMKKDLLKAEK